MGRNVRVRLSDSMSDLEGAHMQAGAVKMSEEGIHHEAKSTYRGKDASDIDWRVRASIKENVFAI